MDCSPPGSPVHGILQARILEWVVTSFSRNSSWPRRRTASPASSALACRFFTTEPERKPERTRRLSTQSNPGSYGRRVGEPLDLALSLSRETIQTTGRPSTELQWWLCHWPLGTGCCTAYKHHWPVPTESRGPPWPPCYWVESHQKTGKEPQWRWPWLYSGGCFCVRIAEAIRTRASIRWSREHELQSPVSFRPKNPEEGCLLVQTVCHK